MQTSPPGPRGFRIIPHILAIRKDYPNQFASLFRTYGDVVRTTYPKYLTFLFHPDHVRYVLKENAKNYRKSDILRALTPLLGQGLLTSDGEYWRKQRAIVAPEFQFQNVRKYTGMMVSAAETMFEAWHNSAKHREVRDLVPDMMRLTFKIAGETMFGSFIDDKADEVAEALGVAMHSALARLRAFVKFPLFLPLPSHLRRQRAIDTLNGLVEGIIDHRIKNPRAESDLLSRLMSAKDPKTGEGMSRSALRDEVMTLILAGHETTSNALSWTWYLLGKNPECLRRLQDEIDTVLAGRSPAYEDLAKLPYLKNVFLESMRIYPPAAAVSRNTLEADEVAGVEIPKDTIVECSQWVTHRHPQFWSDPDRFDPDRFLPERFSRQHPFAYFPFGGGPRECVGKNFAMIEGPLLLALMAQRFVITLVPDQIVEHEPLVTIRPRHLFANLTTR